MATMELALNLFWLLLALASCVLWRREAARAGGPRRFRGVLGSAALACALALLFPVISLTDDLHAQQAVMEDSNPAKRVLKAASHAPSNSGKLSHPFVAGVVSGFSPGSLSLVGGIAPGNRPTASLLALLDSYQGRAPPYLLI